MEAIDKHTPKKARKILKKFARRKLRRRKNDVPVKVSFRKGPHLKGWWS